MQNKRELTQAVFFQGLGDPEVYPRPKGEVYVTGFPGESPAFRFPMSLAFLVSARGSKWCACMCVC